MVREFKNALDQDDDVFAYLTNRLKRQIDFKIFLRNESNHNPAQLAEQQTATASNSEVERSFSKLGKLLSKDNFQNREH